MTRPQTPWADPNEFLCPAYDAAEVPTQERDVAPATPCGAVEAQAEADVQVYKREYEILYRRSESGWYDQDRLLCRVAFHYARLLAWMTPWHVYICDEASEDKARESSSAYFIALEARERLGPAGADVLTSEELFEAEVSQKRTRIRWARIDHVLDKSSSSNCVEALSYFQDQVSKGRQELTADLGRAHLEMGRELALTGDAAGAVRNLDRALELLDWPMRNQGRSDVAPALSDAYWERAVLASNHHDDSLCLWLCDKVIELREWVARIGGGVEPAAALAGAYLNKGKTLMRLERGREAVESFGRAAALCDPWLKADNTRLAWDFVQAHMHASRALLWNIKDPRGALWWAERAKHCLEWLVFEKGKLDHRSELADAWRQIGECHEVLEDYASAANAYQSTVSMRDAIVADVPSPESVGRLAADKLYFAQVLYRLGNYDHARKHAAESLDCMRRINGSTGIDGLDQLLSRCAESAEEIVEKA